MEVDYASKRFNTDESVRDLVSLTLKLDPLPNISEDEKMARLSNKGILPETYIVSSNINEFVQRALDEDPDFAGKPLKDQKAKLLTYAIEITNKLDTAKQIVADVNAGAAGGATSDIIGKIPLAVQQLSLAATRASDAGNTALAASITQKINQLLGQVVDTTEEILE
jgi:hypothetical protein